MKDLVGQTVEHPHLLDASEIYRPEKIKEEKEKAAIDSNGNSEDDSTEEEDFEAGKDLSRFRNYENSDNPNMQRVRNLYRQLHGTQTVEFVKSMHKKWLKFDHFEATMMEVLEKLNEVVDEADPDLDLPNIVHAFQTAERLRQNFPDDDWLHLTGLIHDAGKILAFYGEPQFAVVGDTLPVGCEPQESVVFRNWSFEGNPDREHEVYKTRNGMYEEKCGMENLMMTWGHDEYLYQVLVHNKSTIPKDGLQVIRFHSFFPWHRGGDYRNFMTKDDYKLLKLCKEFSKYDLYTKSDEIPNIEELKPYYQGLIDKYCPGKLKF